METLMLVVTDTDDTALEDVTVRFYSDDGSVFVTQGTTDASGELVVDLPLATYWVRFFKQGYSFATRLRIVFDGAGTWGVEGTDLAAHPPATRAGFCRVTGRVVGVTGRPVKGVVFSFARTRIPRVRGADLLVPSKGLIQTDAQGKLDLELMQGAILDVTLEGDETTVIRARVPDQTSVALEDLLFPYAETAEFADPDLAVDVGADVVTGLTVTLSDGNVLPYDLDDDSVVAPTTWVTITSSDESIATVTLKADGTVTVRGVSAGVTTLTVTALEEVAAVRLPAPIPTYGTCTVTVGGG